MDKLMNLQTAAAYPRAPSVRESSRPLATHTSSSTSSSSSSSSSSESSVSPERRSSSASSSPKPSFEFVRCSRCQRTASLASDNALDGMISIGLNSYYCNRCANLVGYHKNG